MHDPANGLPRTHQRVEKVGVDQVGGAREPENASETLRKLRIPPLDRGPKKARRSFSTRWGVLRSSYTGSRIECTPGTQRVQITSGARDQQDTTCGLGQ
jgi:hypothetical protein